MDTILSPRRRRLLGAIGGCGALVLAGCGERARSNAQDGSALQFSGATMGTTYRVKIAGATLPPSRIEHLAGDVQAALDGVDRGMSLYRPSSELMRLNLHPAAAPLPLSKDLYEVLAVGQQVAELSGGAFDVSIAPLVRAWGFGPVKRQVVPGAERVSAGRTVVDFRALRLDAATRTAVKARAVLQADLGGIAKGYGVDLAARALEAGGIDNYMIEVGGEVRTRGRNAQGQPWRIGIEEPDAVPQRARLVVPLSGRSMATSGDYRIYFEHHGRRYSHEIDPRTAEPIAHGLASVTVVADDCVRADALATALIVLGPQQGWALAQQQQLAAHFIVRDDGRLHDRSTAAFAALMGAA
jgi:thiamine biosynthesis lipoprotein